MKAELVWVIGDDWQGIYHVDGFLEDEGHNFSPYQLVESLGLQDKVQVLYLDEDQLDKLGSEGNFPDRWDDFKEEYYPE